MFWCLRYRYNAVFIYLGRGCGEVELNEAGSSVTVIISA